MVGKPDGIGMFTLASEWAGQQSIGSSRASPAGAAARGHTDNFRIIGYQKFLINRKL
jgi:hypothetical protein